jgi:4-amino-4-deoxy-L-arabinose transferase-like glycosyltransferase
MDRSATTDVPVSGIDMPVHPSPAAVDRRIFVVGGVLFVVLMALSTRYGFQRDELYFLDAARHLQASYVDQPALAPLFTWVSLKLFGVSAPGLRLWPALAAWTTVVIAGLTAREFGGTRRAQLLAAIGAATMPALWGSSHIANTTPYTVLAVAATGLVAARLGRTGDPRWWLAAGLVVGLGTEANHQVGIFAAALVVGVLLSGGRTLLLNRWFAAGATIAVVLEVPDLWWQASHGWATAAMTSALNHQNGGPGNIPVWVVGQLVLVSLPLSWVWIIGLARLWRSNRTPLAGFAGVADGAVEASGTAVAPGTPLAGSSVPASGAMWRALVWAYGLCFVVYALTTGAKIYYLTGAYVFLLAAGAVAIEGWLFARRRRVWILATTLTLVTAVLAVTVLPILPARAGMESNQAETVGWPELVQTVAGVWFSLPPPQRAHAVILTADYSEAGAINELGRGIGLPTAVSGQNTDWWWGPGPVDATTVVTVVPGREDAGFYLAYLHRFFIDIREAARISNPYGVDNIESGGHVYVCTGLRQPWAEMWPELRHYD